MPRPQSVTFRDQITGKINDLLLDEGRVCAQSQNLLAYLAGTLLSYREEGVELAPILLFCDNVDKALQSFPGALTHRIGQLPLDPASGPQIMKDCAPLSNQNWFVFIERTNEAVLNYGVFTYFRLPTAIPLHEGITIDSSIFALLMRKVSSSTIEMRGARGNILFLIFSATRETLVQEEPIRSFAADCCKTITDAEGAKPFNEYLVRLLESALTSSHGTILVCCDGIDLSQIAAMRDAVLVRPALDLFTAFREYQASNTAAALINLQRCEELLAGFLRCDGLVVFDVKARVLAYRVFFKPETSAQSAPIVGGARRRAYEGLKVLVGQHLISVIFRSQDGLTLYHNGALR